MFLYLSSPLSNTIVIHTLGKTQTLHFVFLPSLDNTSNLLLNTSADKRMPSFEFLYTRSLCFPSTLVLASVTQGWLITPGGRTRPRSNRANASQDHREQLDCGSGKLPAHSFRPTLQAMLCQKSLGAARPQVPLLSSIQ